MRQVTIDIWTRPPVKRHKAPVIELLLLILALFGLSPATAATVDRVTLSDGAIQIAFSAPVGSAQRFALDGPTRIAFDIAGATPGSAATGANALVNRVRQGAISDGALRIVLDLAQPATISDAQFSADGRSLTIQLRGATLAEFRSIVSAGRQLIVSPLAGVPTLAMAERPARRYQVSVPIGRARPGAPLPAIAGPNDRTLPLVVIDAGHGGHDPGALSPDGRFHEEQLTLAMARATRDALLATGRVRVALTRDSDRFLVLEERYGIAQRLGADMFISIHADAAENHEATGAAIYTLSETASDREAARLAARENRANMLGNIDLGGQSADVRSILIDLTQRETMNLSSDFARTLQRVSADSIPFRRGSHRFAGFVVLKAPDIPSILLEAGFITNSADAERLASAGGQQAIARGLTAGILAHFARQTAGERAAPPARTTIASR